jgi:hypothetical protein
LGEQSYDRLLTAASRPLETIPLIVAATIHIWIGTKAETGGWNSWYRAPAFIHHTLLTNVGA